VNESDEVFIEEVELCPACLCNGSYENKESERASMKTCDNDKCRVGFYLAEELDSDNSSDSDGGGHDE